MTVIEKYLNKRTNQTRKKNDVFGFRIIPKFRKKVQLWFKKHRIDFVVNLRVKTMGFPG